MPTYVFETQDGRIVEWNAPMRAIPQALLVNGKIAPRIVPPVGQSSCDPWTDHSSLALSVHPLDVRKYRKDAHEKGVGKNVRIRDDGYMEFRSRDDQKKYCRAYGYVNYGDVW